MFDIPKIRAAMAEKGYNQKVMAQKIHKSEKTTGRMLRTGSCGTETAQLIVDALDLSAEKAIEIFLRNS